jgi:hypothetical protein
MEASEMGILKDFLQGFADGAAAAAAVAAHNSRPLIERLLAELGWPTGDWSGDCFYLRFTHSDGGMRTVRITAGQQVIVTFSSDSFATVPARSVPPEFLAWLLYRNLTGDCVGQWGMNVSGEAVTFHVMYSALALGLDAQAMKWICESLVADAGEVDARLRALR